MCEVENCLLPEHFTGFAKCRQQFAELGNTVMQGFAADVQELVATLEIKLDTVGKLQAKVMAGFVSVLIAGAQLIGDLVFTKDFLREPMNALVNSTSIV